jgi:hypothetical protein
MTKFPCKAAPPAFSVAREGLIGINTDEEEEEEEEEFDIIMTLFSSS